MKSWSWCMWILVFISCLAHGQCLTVFFTVPNILILLLKLSPWRLFSSYHSVMRQWCSIAITMLLFLGFWLSPNCLMSRHSKETLHFLLRYPELMKRITETLPCWINNPESRTFSNGWLVSPQVLWRTCYLSTWSKLVNFHQELHSL